MTSITSVLPGKPQWQSLTVRQSGLALAWTVGLVALSTVWYHVEKYGLDLPLHYRAARFLPTIAIGIPHILIGFVFALTSRRMKLPWASGKMIGLLALGGVGCWLFHRMGGARVPNQLTVVAVSFYFVVHLLRDQRFFYVVLGEAPQEDGGPSDILFLRALQTMILIFIGGLSVIGLDVYARYWRPEAFPPLDYVFGSALSLSSRVWLVGGLAVALIALRFHFWRRTSSKGFAEMLGRNRPLVAVLMLFFGLMLASGGTGKLFQALVLWHVLEWMIYASRSIGASEKPERGKLSVWQRVRATRRGFLALHVGGALAVFATILIWTYGTGKTAPVGWMVGVDSFYYWTIMHVTVSFHQ